MSHEPRTIRPGNQQCLHCWLSAAMDVWLKENAPLDPVSGKPLVEVSTALCKVGELVAELIAALPDRPSRRVALKYARTCVDAAYRLAVTGKV